MCVPQPLRQQVIYECHDSPLTGGHLGPDATWSKFRERYHWLGAYSTIRAWVKTCQLCQQFNSSHGLTGDNIGNLIPVAILEAGKRVNTDQLGPFPVTTRGNCYLLVLIDIAIKWVEAFAMKTGDSKEYAEILARDYIT